MKHNPEKHHRRSIRLKGFDYSQAGCYYMILVTQNRECLFGDVVDGEMVLNDAGWVAQTCWLEIPNHFPNVHLDAFIIMPNHIHGIIFIIDNEMGKSVGVQNFEPLQRSNQNKYQQIISHSIGSIIRGFKIGVTKWFRHNTDIYTVWQRNYWEHVIRDENELNHIREYIINNPLKWESDDENPNRW
jgi:REP element-mobilizing transposase RayT